MPEISNYDVKQALDAVRSISDRMEKGSLLTPEQKSILDSANSKLDEFEAANTENTQKWLAAENEKKALNDRIESLERDLSRGSNGTGGVDYKNSDGYKALQECMVKGIDKVREEYKSGDLLRSDNDVAGGVLGKTETVMEIMKPITEISPMRQLARIRQMAGVSIALPKRVGRLSSSWEGETEEDEGKASKYGTQTNYAHRIQVTAPATLDQLNSSMFDMENEIFSDVREDLAYKEGIAFTSGNGDKKPTGFLFCKDIVNSAFASQTAGAITGDDFLLIQGEVKAGYKLTGQLNRRTLAKARTLKDKNNNYIWNPGLNGSTINNIGGIPYVINDAMPDIANNAIPYAIGDWYKGYTIFDRIALSVIRDDYTRKKAAIVEFTFHKWVGGDVTNAEAIKALKIKAS